MIYMPRYTISVPGRRTNKLIMENILTARGVEVRSIQDVQYVARDVKTTYFTLTTDMRIKELMEKLEDDNYLSVEGELP